LGQLLFESVLWLLVSRGQSQRMLKLLLMISPIIIGGYAIGLPFGIKGVALSGSLVLLGVFPWVLQFSFRGTSLTLQRLGRGILYPVFVCVSGVVVSELALHLISYKSIGSQLAVTALGFAAGLSLSMLVPAVREELMSLTVLFRRSRSGSLELAETPS
jgi:hypothetical protein